MYYPGPGVKARPSSLGLDAIEYLGNVFIELERLGLYAPGPGSEERGFFSGLPTIVYLDPSLPVLGFI